MACFQRVSIYLLLQLLLPQVSLLRERESQVIPTVLAAMSELEQALGGMALDESTGNDTGMEGLLDQEQDVPGPQDQDQALLANEEVLQLLPEVFPCVICRRTHEDNLE